MANLIDAGSGDQIGGRKLHDRPFSRVGDDNVPYRGVAGRLARVETEREIFSWRDRHAISCEVAAKSNRGGATGVGKKAASSVEKQLEFPRGRRPRLEGEREKVRVPGRPDKIGADQQQQWQQ